MIADDVVLDCQGVQSGYGDALVVRGVNITCRKGTIVTVMGPNGSGKSTLMKTIVGLIAHRAGTTVVRNRQGQAIDITRKKAYELGQLGVSYVPQVANVFADMSVLENLQMGTLPLADKANIGRRLEAVLEYFPAVRQKLRARAGTLSGGQRQMVAMARALIADPTLLLLDEPSAGLQPDIVDDVFTKIREFSRLGLTILVVEQKARQSLAFSDYGYVLDMGENRYEGTGPALVSDPVVIDLYLGAGRRAPPAEESLDVDAS
jgi:ABC-type branched-subunit amino acid transport system ATPase component